MDVLTHVSRRHEDQVTPKASIVVQQKRHLDKMQTVNEIRVCPQNRCTNKENICVSAKVYLHVVGADSE